MFGNPRGMTFRGDGALLLADARRNTVYAIEPQTNGEVGPTSPVRSIIGDGTSAFFAPLGERYPGERMSIREPVGLTSADDGTIFVLTTYGAAAYDPVSREAEWLFFWGGLDELELHVELSVLNILAISANTLS